MVVYYNNPTPPFYPPPNYTYYPPPPPPPPLSNVTNTHSHILPSVYYHDNPNNLIYAANSLKPKHTIPTPNQLRGYLLSNHTPELNLSKATKQNTEYFYALVSRFPEVNPYDLLPYALNRLDNTPATNIADLTLEELQFQYQQYWIVQRELEEKRKQEEKEEQIQQAQVEQGQDSEQIIVRTDSGITIHQNPKINRKQKVNTDKENEHSIYNRSNSGKMNRQSKAVKIVNPHTRQTLTNPQSSASAVPGIARATGISESVNTVTPSGNNSNKTAINSNMNRDTNDLPPIGTGRPRSGTTPSVKPATGRVESPQYTRPRHGPSRLRFEHKDEEDDNRSPTPTIATPGSIASTNENFHLQQPQMMQTDTFAFHYFGGMMPGNVSNFGYNPNVNMSAATGFNQVPYNMNMNVNPMAGLQAQMSMAGMGGINMNMNMNGMGMNMGMGGLPMNNMNSGMNMLQPPPPGFQDAMSNLINMQSQQGGQGSGSGDGPYHQQFPGNQFNNNNNSGNNGNGGNNNDPPPSNTNTANNENSEILNQILAAIDRLSTQLTTTHTTLSDRISSVERRMSVLERSCDSINNSFTLLQSTQDKLEARTAAAEVLYKRSLDLQHSAARSFKGLNKQCEIVGESQCTLGKGFSALHEKLEADSQNVKENVGVINEKVDVVVRNHFRVSKGLSMVEMRQYNTQCSVDEIRRHLSISSNHNSNPDVEHCESGAQRRRKIQAVAELLNTNPVTGKKVDTGSIFAEDVKYTGSENYPADQHYDDETVALMMDQAFRHGAMGDEYAEYEDKSDDGCGQGVPLNQDNDNNTTSFEGEEDGNFSIVAVDNTTTTTTTATPVKEEEDDGKTVTPGSPPAGAAQIATGTCSPLRSVKGSGRNSLRAKKSTARPGLKRI